jgi:hypothetical protein
VLASGVLFEFVQADHAGGIHILDALAKNLIRFYDRRRIPPRTSLASPSASARLIFDRAAPKIESFLFGTAELASSYIESRNVRLLSANFKLVAALPAGSRALRVRVRGI